MPDTTNRDLTISDAQTAIRSAMSFHVRQAESYAEYGEGTEEDQSAERFHRASVRALVASLSILVGPEEARETEALAWRRASEAVSGA